MRKKHGVSFVVWIIFWGDTLLPGKNDDYFLYTIRRIPLFTNAGLHEVYHSVLFFFTALFGAQ